MLENEDCIGQPIEYPLIERMKGGYCVRPANLMVYDRDCGSWAAAYFAARNLLSDESRWVKLGNLPQWVRVNGVFSVNYRTALGRITKSFTRNESGYKDLLCCVAAIRENPMAAFRRMQGQRSEEGSRDRSASEYTRRELSSYKVYHNHKAKAFMAIITPEDAGNKIEKALTKTFSFKKAGSVEKAKLEATNWRENELKRFV
jgi:hypothetical protein